MKRGSGDTVAALAIGGGLVAVIGIYEAVKARGKKRAPVVTHGNRGRWSIARVGFDPLGDLADIAESIGSAVADIVDEAQPNLDPNARNELIEVVMRAAFNQAKKDPKP